MIMNGIVYLVIIIAIVVFINVYLVLKLTSKMYKTDGEIVVTTDLETGKKVFSLEIDKTPEEIEAMDVILFRVNSQNGTDSR
jgi:hypothetical protein